MMKERKKQIDYYYDHCTRENHDRWYSLGLEAIIVADQAETEQNKIKYLQLSHYNFAKTVKDDGFMAASQALAVGKEYYKINEYENALDWFEKARLYYDKTNHTKLEALPIFIGDTYLAMGQLMTATEFYSEAYENLCTETSSYSRNHCAELSDKMNNAIKSYQ